MKHFELATEDLKLNKDKILEAITTNENILERAENIAVDNLHEATEIEETFMSNLDLLRESLTTMNKLV